MFGGDVRYSSAVRRGIWAVAAIMLVTGHAGAAAASADGTSPAESSDRDRPRVEVTTSIPVAGELGVLTADVTGARILSISMLIDGWYVGEPFTITGQTATGSVTWPDAGVHALVARVTVRGGRTLVSRTSIVVAPMVRDRLQIVYVHPSDTEPVRNRAASMAHEARAVDDWFAGQLGGSSPRFATDASGNPSVVVVRAALDSQALDREDDVGEVITASLRATGTIAQGSVPIVFLEGRQSGANAGACGWTTGGVDRHITIPMANCSIYPSTDSTFPYGGTYVLAHEITHALGAVGATAPHHDGTGHVNDDPRDILFNGTAARDLGHLMIDPGHDDYYLTGRADLAEIQGSPLLEGVAVSVPR